MSSLQPLSKSLLLLQVTPREKIEWYL
jgi:hypothetical protein